MQTTMLFEYTCPECGIGTVKTTQVHNYKTKIKGYPFTVDEALIGVCDHCRTEHYAPEETKRWEELFARSLEERQAFLPPSEITELRKNLDLAMEDFARLIGSTRQSIHSWEKSDRTSPPIRTADLLMKLVRQSLRDGKVDVIAFLLQEAKKWGVTIELHRNPMSSEKSIPLRTRQSSGNASTRNQNKKLALAAESITDDEEFTIVESLDGKAVGKLTYDYARAALILEFTGNPPSWKEVDVEIETKDGKHLTNKKISVHDHNLVLLEKTPIREDVVSQIILKPY